MGIGSVSHSLALEVLGSFMFGGIKGQQNHDVLDNDDDDDDLLNEDDYEDDDDDDDDDGNDEGSSQDRAATRPEEMQIWI